MKTLFPSAKRLLDHHSSFGVRSLLASCPALCCVQRHLERAASIPTVARKDTIIRGTIVDLQISANVTCTEHVTIVHAF